MTHDLSGDADPIQQEILLALDRETSALQDAMLGNFLEIDLQGGIVFDDVSGGHILTYLSREADRMADELLAATGRPVPAPDPDRQWEVRYGADRPGAVLIDDVIESSERLQDAIAGTRDWSALPSAVHDIPAQRLVQLIIHHADLGRSWDSVPDENALVAASQLPTIMPEALADIRLVLAKHVPLTVGSSGNETIVEGDPKAILRWASGRGTAADENLPVLARRNWY